MTKKTILALLMAAMMVFCFTACGGSDSATDDNTLIYGSNDYTRINPAIDEHGEINLLIFDGLMGHDENNAVVPAEHRRRKGKTTPLFSVTHRCDGERILFYLRSSSFSTRRSSN